ncbi:carbohydrate sulfotransferase 1-like [Haliotis rufescens]|uniref:carbohydrate sulfotransferase 1-like n=1 Tax=Haliotis rufescens TaxID=6454 RepID=UPI00201EDFE6|nr:carbohydrate sulfotransferase 1-like [Haliotis rufescens]
MTIKAYSKWRLINRRSFLCCLLVLGVLTMVSLWMFLITNTYHHHSQSIEAEVTQTQPRKVLILSYMRSGSTLTADIVQQHPDVFYVFEPLFSVENIRRAYLAPVYLDRPSRLLSSKSEYATKVDILKAILSCSLTSVDLQTLHQHHMDKSKTTVKYNQCIHNTTIRDFESKCLNTLIDKCRGSEISLIKTIRVKMEATEELLHLNKDLKVILLIRDPRATLMSRIRLAQLSWRKFDVVQHHVKVSFSHCGLVLRDVRDAVRLSKRYPGRVGILLYEKLIENPTYMTQLIYDFLDLKLTPNIANYVYNITEAGFPDSCPLCTTRKNSTETANRWRHDLSLDSVMQIDQNCFPLYEQLGYLPFKTYGDLLNTNVPSWLEKPIPGLLTDRMYSTEPRNPVL